MKIKAQPVKQKITVSQTEFSKIVEVTPQRISKILNDKYSGRLVIDENRKIVLFESLDRWFKYFDTSKVRGEYIPLKNRKQIALENCKLRGYERE